MNIRSKITASLASLALIGSLTACSAADLPTKANAVSGTSSATSTSTTSASATTSTSSLSATAAAIVDEVTTTHQKSHASVEDSTPDAQTTAIALTGSSATAAGSGATVSGSTVTINTAGTYVLSGELAGRIVVDSAAEGTVKIVLNGAAITSSDGAAIQVNAADEVSLILAEGTQNTVTDSAKYAATADTDPNAAIWSKADLTITGEGSLSVKGQYNDAINVSDGVVIESGNITITATDDGIRGKDYVSITGGTVAVTAGGDGIKSDNETDADRGWIEVSGGQVTIKSGQDGVQAYTDVVTTGGTLTVDAGDDGIHSEKHLVIAGGETTVAKSVEGIESAIIRIAGGKTSVTSSDDGVNVSGANNGSGMPGRQQADNGQYLEVSDGELTVDAAGDGLDANGAIKITGGVTIVYGPTNNGNGALDVDGSFLISGGQLLAIGAAGMAVAPDATSSQGWIAGTVSGKAGDTLVVKNGSTILGEFAAKKAFQSVVFSSAEVAKTGSYTVAVNGSETSVTADQAPAGSMGGPGGAMGGGRGPR